MTLLWRLEKNKLVTVSGYKTKQQPFQTHQNEEEGDEERHPALYVLAGDEEGGPADHYEERAGQVVGDHVVRHAPRQHHLEPGHAVVACSW